MSDDRGAFMTQMRSRHGWAMAQKRAFATTRFFSRGGREVAASQVFRNSDAL